jgi:hypothetical protein
MSVNVKDLSLLLQELSEMTVRKNWDKQAEKRHTYLLAAISAVKAGASLADVDREIHNERSRAAGLPTVEARKEFNSTENTLSFCITYEPYRG